MTYTEPKVWAGVSQSTNRPHSGAYIVYINGIEVPTKSVSQRYGVWQIPEMQVEMVADPVLTRLGTEDRVQVVVFYLDDIQPDTSVKPQFRLFGEGEITAWGYQNTPGGRSIVFTCVNQFAILSQLFVQFLTQVDDYAAYAVSPTTSQFGTATSSIVFPYSLFTEGLLRTNPVPATTEGEPTSTEPAATTPVGATSDATQPPEAGAASSSPDAAPADTSTSTTETSENTSTSEASVTTENTSTPEAAATTATTSAPTNVAAVVTGVASETVPNAIKRPFDFMFNVVKAMLEKKVPDTVRTVPVSNFFSRWARLTNFVNRFAGFPVFDEVGDKNIFPALKALQSVNAVDILVKNLLPQMQGAGSLFDMLQLVYQQVFMEIAMIPMMPLVRVNLKTRLIETTPFAEHVLKKDTTDNRTRYVAKTPTVPAQPRAIPNYFSKPQCLFGLPPACNVIFPSQLKMFSYSENYATQPTRLQFNDETVNNIFKTPGVLRPVISNALATGYPPEVDIGNQLRLSQAGVNGKNFLLFPEEFFKGPVMDRRQIPPWLFFIKQAEYKKETGVDLGSVPPGTPTVDGAPSTSGGAATTAGTTAATTAATNPINQFVWPMPAATDGRKPFVRADFQSHLNRKVPVPLYAAGVDIYYPRNNDGSEPFLARGKRPQGYTQDPHYTQSTAVPPGSMCIAAGPGKVTKAAETPYGFSVTISHNDGEWRTYYTHMRQGSGKVRKGDTVVAGSPLGEVYYDPRDGEKVFHVHFGLYPRGSTDAVDPMPFMRNWGVVGAPVVASPSQPAAPATATAAAPVPDTNAAATAPPGIDMALYERLKAEDENVYQTYAKYEYFRERYEKRTGSAILTWNPYVVPGFPAAFFDARTTRIDVFGYITTVQQRMSQRDRQTDISYVYGRTIQEVFDLLKHEFALGSAVLGNAPKEPIKDVRKILQSFVESESMYRKLFYGGQQLYGKDAAFDWRKIIGYAPMTADGIPEPIFIAGKEETTNDTYTEAVKNVVALQPKIDELDKANAVAQQKWNVANGIIAALSTYDGGAPPPITVENLDQAPTILGAAFATNTLKNAEALMAEAQRETEAINAQLLVLKTQKAAALDTIHATEASLSITGSGVVHNVTGDREIVPLPTAEAMFREYDAAMAYNWRPICTLDEYIIFHDSAGEESIPAVGHERSLGARYFERIRRMTPLKKSFTFPVGADGLQRVPDSSIEVPMICTTEGEQPATWTPMNYVTAPENQDADETPVSTADGTTEATSGVLAEVGSVATTSTENAAALTQEEKDVQATATVANMTRVPGLTGSTGEHGENGANDFPQTRADWDTILIAYRNNVYYVKAPRG